MTACFQAIAAVIVLYRRTAAESEAFQSLAHIIASDPGIGERISLLLYDNSPTSSHAQAVSGFPVRYVHDSSNKGLAAAYTFALRQAVADKKEWLLLLDQDTTLTVEYVLKVLRAVEDPAIQSGVAALVPILEMDGRVYSPEADFFYHLRHQFPYMRNYPVPHGTDGIQPQKLNAYNSGACLRVSALEQIGGFPPEFPLDYLDHAVFYRLQQHGFLIQVLDTNLQQKLSHIDLNHVLLARHSSVLASQQRFVALYGAWFDRWLFRLWLLRKARHYRRLCRDPRVWKGMVRQALSRWRRQ